MIQVAILLTVASLVLVATLPGFQTKLTSDKNSAAKLNNVMMVLREFEIANGRLPCPADAGQPVGGTYYGIEAANNTNGCTGGTPAADLAGNNVAVGMLPVKTLGLSNDAALDDYGRYITYAADTAATGCWASQTLSGNIIVDNPDYSPGYGSAFAKNSVAALVSHGADGYGAMLPIMSGSGGTVTRFDAGSTDTDEALNAHVTSGTVTPYNNTTQGTDSNNVAATFVNKKQTKTFDDMVVFGNRLWSINELPLTNAMPVLSSYPANGTYTSGSASPWNSLTFTLTFPNSVIVNTSGGTPYLAVTALTCNGNTINGSTGNGSCTPVPTGKATYTSGSGTKTLTFTYSVLSNDSASGVAVGSSIIMNGGAISGAASTCFFPPNLSQVILSPGSMIYVVDDNNGYILEYSPTTLALLGSPLQPYPASTLSGLAIALDSSGSLWIGSITNCSSNCVGAIGKYSSGGALLYSFNANAVPNTYPANGYNTLGFPMGLAFDAFGNLWELDAWDNQVNEFTSSGTYMTSFLNGGSRALANYKLSTLTGGGDQEIAFDGMNNLWSNDSGNCEVLGFTLGSSTSTFTGYITSGVLTVKTAPTLGSVQQGATIATAPSGGTTIPAGTTITGTAQDQIQNGGGGTGTYLTSVSGSYGTNASPITMYAYTGSSTITTPASSVFIPNYIATIGSTCGSGATQIGNNNNDYGNHNLAITGPSVAATFAVASGGFSGSGPTYTMTVSNVLGGALAAGQVLNGSGIAPGTYIVSGSGMTWTIYSPSAPAVLYGGYVIYAVNSASFTGSLSTSTNQLTIATMPTGYSALSINQSVTGGTTSANGVPSGTNITGLVSGGGGVGSVYSLSSTIPSNIATETLYLTLPITIYVQDTTTSGSQQRVDIWQWTGSVVNYVNKINSPTTYTNGAYGIAIDPISGNLYVGSIGTNWNCTAYLLNASTGAYMNKSIGTPSQCTTLQSPAEIKIYYNSSR